MKNRRKSIFTGLISVFCSKELRSYRISGISINSMNHYSYGAVLEWMFRHAAGINVAEDAPGGTQICMEPLLHMGIGHMEASYDAQAGCYRVRWELTDAEHVVISVTIPFGCEALLKLPLAPEDIYRDSTNPIFSDVRGTQSVPGSQHTGNGGAVWGHE